MTRNFCSFIKKRDKYKTYLEIGLFKISVEVVGVKSLDDFLHMVEVVFAEDVLSRPDEFQF